MTRASPSYRSLWLPDLLGLFALVAIATVPFLSPDLDLRIMRHFLAPGTVNWPGEAAPLWRFLYRFGTLPAVVVALAGLAVAVLAPFLPRLVPWRRQAAFLFLTLMLGPGLFVNTIFKDHWGRPRPRQVVELGGNQTYQCFYERGTAGRGKAFPCGHSSMGYYFVVLYFLNRRNRPGRALILLAGALIFGTLIGLARMAAGAHFPSDVAWSSVFPAAVAWLLYYFILDIPGHRDGATPSNAFWNSRLLIWLGLPLAGATLAAFLFATPQFKEVSYDFTMASAPPPVIELQCTDRVKIIETVDSNMFNRIRITGEIQGFGWPWSHLTIAAGPLDGAPEGQHFLLTVQPRGTFSELDGTLVVRAPPGTAYIRKR